MKWGLVIKIELGYKEERWIMKLESLEFDAIQFDQMDFETEADFQIYMNGQWDKEPLQSIFKKTNDRFEQIVRNSINLRHDVRTGAKDTGEEIEVTFYQYLQNFMSYTKQELEVGPVKLGGQIGMAVFHLYKKTVKFVPDED